MMRVLALILFSASVLVATSAVPAGAVAAGSQKLVLVDSDAATRSVLLQALVGTRLRLTLQHDVVLVGQLESVQGTSCRFHVEGELAPRTLDIGAVKFAEHFISKPMVRSSPLKPEVARSVADAVKDRQPRKVMLTSKRSYVGRVLKGRDPATVRLALPDGVEIIIPTVSIASVIGAGETRSLRARPRRKRSRARDVDVSKLRDPNRTRYLFAPSAMMLEEGTGYFSQKQLAFSEVAYGVHDNVSILAGGVLPAWLIEPPDSFNLSVGAKLGWELTDNLYWASGIYGLVVPGGGSGNVAGGGFLFTTLTGGKEHLHASLTLGLPFIFNSDEEFLDPVLIFAANMRVSEGLALVTENWIFPSLLASEEERGGTINAISMRFLSHDFSTDVGFVHVLGLSDDVPLLPWLDFTYNW